MLIEMNMLRDELNQLRCDVKAATTLPHNVVKEQDMNMFVD
jgi:hypothetical protein